MVNYEKLVELFRNEEFQKEAESFKTMDDFKESFMKHGIEMTDNEVVELVSQIARKKEDVDNDEIVEEDLENVAGGLVISTAVFCIGVGVVCIGAACVAAYAAYQALDWSYKPAKSTKKKKKK